MIGRHLLPYWRILELGDIEETLRKMTLGLESS